MINHNVSKVHNGLPVVITEWTFEANTRVNPSYLLEILLKTISDLQTIKRALYFTQLNKARPRQHRRFTASNQHPGLFGDVDGSSAVPSGVSYLTQTRV